MSTFCVCKIKRMIDQLCQMLYLSYQVSQSILLVELKQPTFFTTVKNPRYCSEKFFTIVGGRNDSINTVTILTMCGR